VHIVRLNTDLTWCLSTGTACGCQTSLKFSVGLSLEFDYNFCTVRYCWSVAYGVLFSLLFHRGFYLVQNALYLQIWIYRLQRCSVMRDLVGHASHLSAYTTRHDRPGVRAGHAAVTQPLTKTVATRCHILKRKRREGKGKKRRGSTGERGRHSRARP